MLIFESGGVVIEVVGSSRKRVCMHIFEGRGSDGVGKEQLPSKTRLVFEDKKSDMTRRVLPLLAMSEMVSRRYASKHCVVSYNTHNFVKTTHQLLGMGIIVPIPSPHSFSPAALSSLYCAHCCNVAVWLFSLLIVEVVMVLAIRTTTGPWRGFQFPDVLNNQDNTSDVRFLFCKMVLVHQECFFRVSSWLLVISS